MAIGRPRAFDIDEALDRALKVFWRKGYEGTSLSDLTEALGINRPSLYAAFGNKEQLFRKVMERYQSGPASYLQQSLAAPTARAMAEQLLHATADALGCPDRPAGCLVVQAALSCGDAGDAMRKELIARRLASEAAIRDRLVHAREQSDLPADADPEELARYLVTVMYGMAVHAAGGANRDQLHQIADRALHAWPAG
jgi:AcrR family transcriptional regulator